MSWPSLHAACTGGRAGRISVSRLTATGCYRAAASVESWVDTPIEQVTLRDIQIAFTRGSDQKVQEPVRMPPADARGRARGVGLSPHAGPDLTFSAKRAIRGVDVHPPHHDGGWRAPDRRPLLGEGPTGIDRLARLHGPGEFPVQPFPLGNRGHRHVHGPQADCHGDQQGGWRKSSPGVGDVDRQGGEVAGNGGKERDFSFRDGPPSRGPLATEGQVVERDRFQVGSEYIGIRIWAPGVNL